MADVGTGAAAIPLAELTLRRPRPARHRPNDSECDASISFRGATFRRQMRAVRRPPRRPASCPFSKPEGWGKCLMRSWTTGTDDQLMQTPRAAADAVIAHPRLPAGEDERFVGFAVMGPPFASGHYLALRHFPATSWSPGYRSVWHRDPAGVWTFYATTSGRLSCARHFGAATPNDAVQCDIEETWLTPWSLRVRVEGLLDWTIDMRTTVSTRTMSLIGARLPAGAWTNRMMLAAMGRAAGALLGVGQLRLLGTAPSGQEFMLAPALVWAVSGSRAVLAGEDLGPVGPLDRQARLAGMLLPQRGLYAVGHGQFARADPAPPSRR